MSGGTHNGPDRCIHNNPTNRPCSYCAHTAVQVATIPNCDLCSGSVKRPAFVDGKTKLGPWAYMCRIHFTTHGVGLGLGKGQRLVKRP